MKKVIFSLVALFAFALSNNAQTSILNTQPIFGGFTVKYEFKSVNSKNPLIASMQSSGSPTFSGVKFLIKTLIIKADTVITDTICDSVYSSIPKSPSVFYIRLTTKDTAGTIAYSNIVKVETWAIPAKPTITTTQASQNIQDTVFSFLKYTTNVKAVLYQFMSFSKNNVIDMSNMIDSVLLDSGTDVNYIKTTPGIPSGSTVYEGYIIKNYAGNDTVQTMKVAPYATNQKPAGSIDSTVLNSKKISLFVKCIGYNLPTTAQIYYGKTSSTLTDTLTRILFTGKGVEHGSWITPTLDTDQTYYFKIRLTNSKGYIDLSTSKYIPADPAVFTLETDSGYSANIDPVNGTMDVITEGSYQLASGSSYAKVWSVLSEDSTFSTSQTSSQWTTTGSAGTTNPFKFTNVTWSKTKTYFVKLRGMDDKNTIVWASHYRKVTIAQPRNFSINSKKVDIDKANKSAKITAKFVNTEKTTADIFLSYSEDSTFTNGVKTTSSKLCSGDSGDVTFDITNLKDVKYFYQVSGTNSISENAVSLVKSFKLNLTPFTLVIKNIVMDNNLKKARVYIDYVNTEGTTSSVDVAIDTDPNFTNPVHSSNSEPCLNDNGTVFFDIGVLDTSRYYVVASGSNTDGGYATSASASFKLYTKPSVGIEQVAQNSNLQIYPNPTTDYITITFDGNSNQQFQLFGLNGQKVITKNITSGEKIDVNGLPSGTYVYSFGNTIGKIVIVSN